MARPTISYKSAGAIATGTDGTTFGPSGSYTATANTLVLVIACIQRGSGLADDFTVAHSGSLGSLTATSLTNIFSNGTVASGSRLKAFYAYAGSSPTAGTFTITCTNTHSGAILHVFEIASPHLTTPEKQNAVTNEVVDSTATLTATLGAACSTNSLIVGIFSSDNGAAATITDPAAGGWQTRLSDTNHTANTQRQVVWYNTSEVQSFESNPSASADYCVAIMEFQEAAAATGQIVIINHMRQQGAS